MWVPGVLQRPKWAVCLEIEQGLQHKDPKKKQFQKTKRKKLQVLKIKWGKMDLQSDLGIQGEKENPAREEEDEEVENFKKKMLQINILVFRNIMF